MNTTTDTRFCRFNIVSNRKHHLDASGQVRSDYHLTFICCKAGSTHELVLDEVNAKELLWLLQSYPELGSKEETMKDEALLERHGWTVECQSPFEIRHEDGSFASEQAAYMVLRFLKDDEEAGGDEQVCGSEADPADVCEAIINRLVREPALDAAIQGMTVADYDKLEDDICEIILGEPVDE